MFVFGEIGFLLKGRSAEKIGRLVLNLSYIKDFVIEKATYKLSGRGEDKNQNILRTDKGALRNSFYALRTEQYKRRKGEPINKVTLFDKGAFYDSFKVNLEQSYYIVSANFNKKNNNIYTNFKNSYKSVKDFESAVLGLTEPDLTDFLFNDFLPVFSLTLQTKIKLINRAF